MGLFINHEGGDGSGKATQAELNRHFLMNEGFVVGHQAFPRYDTETGKIIRRYLRGEIGQDMTLMEKSQLYADDRLAAKPEMVPFIELDGWIQQTDRFTPSNMAHMGGVILEATARHEFFEAIRHNEFDVMGIPKPDLNIIHMIPAHMSMQNIQARHERNGTGGEIDIHEQQEHLERASMAYAELAQLYPDEFVLINCMQNFSKMRGMQDIHEEVKHIVQTRLS